jgi:dihydrodipicolinate synthase/N-acetylneuraminate lyase
VEFDEIASAARDACNDMLCIIGCAWHNVREEVRRVKSAENIGADGALFFLSHYAYYGASDDDLYENCRMVNDATREISLIAYSYPPETGYSLSPDLVNRLLDFDRLTAIVTSSIDAPEGLAEVTELTRRFEGRLSILDVCEPGLHLIVALGGKGCLAPYGLAMPTFLLDYYDACKTSPRKSLDFYQKITRYPWENALVGLTFPGEVSHLFPGNVTILTGYKHSIAGRKTGWLFPGTVVTHKAMVEASGHKAGPPRLPFLPPGEKLRAFAKNWLKDIGRDVSEEP